MKTKQNSGKLTLNKTTIAHLELKGKEMKNAYAGGSRVECDDSIPNCFTQIAGISCVYFTCNFEQCPNSMVC